MKIKEVTDKVDKASTKFANTMIGDRLTKFTDIIFFLLLGYMYYLIIPQESVTYVGAYEDMPNWLASYFTLWSSIWAVLNQAIGNFVHALGAIIWIAIKLFIIAPYSLWVNYFSAQVGYKTIEQGLISPDIAFGLMITWMTGWVLIWSGIINSWEKGLKIGFKIVIYMTAISTHMVRNNQQLGERFKNRI